MPFPDECAESAESLKSQAIVEADSAGVQVRDRQSDFFVAVARGFLKRHFHQPLAQTHALELSGDGNLRNVCGTTPDCGDGQHGGQLLSWPVQGYQRCFWKDLAASTLGHDVFDQMSRSSEGNVLVINLTIDVAAVSA